MGEGTARLIVDAWGKKLREMERIADAV